MADKDVALALLSNGIAIAGLLLVFMGFLLGKADATPLARARKKIRFVAISGLVPFLLSLACALMSIWALQGGLWSNDHLFAALKLVLAATAIYAIMAVCVLEIFR